MCQAGELPQSLEGRRGAHRVCGGGSPGGQGEGLSHQQAGAESFTFFMAGLRDTDIFVARTKLLALEFNTFYQLQARWKYLAGQTAWAGDAGVDSLGKR